jgi:AraC-like DNA-binding protein
MQIARTVATRWLPPSRSFGRQANELLALGYMRDLVRMFVGKDWQPSSCDAGQLMAQAAVEQALGVGIARGAGDARHADGAARRRICAQPAAHSAVAAGRDDVTEWFVPARCWTNARVDWVAKRLAYRAAAAVGDARARFRTIRQAVSCERAHAMLAAGMRVTEIAYELGYSDPAHFSRAFRAWTGRPPQRWR